MRDEIRDVCFRLNFFELVYELVREVPKGRVTTYSAIARHLGNPRGARAVGWAMRACTTPNVPCHRVIKADGDIGGYSSANGVNKKIAMLKREGVRVRDRRIDLTRYFFDDFNFGPTIRILRKNVAADLSH